MVQQHGDCRPAFDRQYHYHGWRTCPLCHGESGPTAVNCCPLNKNDVPANALLIQGTITVIFILAANNLGTLGDVLDYIGLPLTIIMGATVAGVLF